MIAAGESARAAGTTPGECVDPVETEDRIIGVVEWRDGTVIDVVRQVKN